MIGRGPSAAQQVVGGKPNARSIEPILLALWIEDQGQGRVEHLLQASGPYVLKPGLAIEEQQNRRMVHHDDFRRIVAVVGAGTPSGRPQTRFQSRQRERKIPLRHAGLYKLDQRLNVSLGEVREAGPVDLNRCDVSEILVSINIERGAHPQGAEQGSFVLRPLDGNRDAAVERYPVERIWLRLIDDNLGLAVFDHVRPS
jgi:hypothetical protein